MKKRFIIIGGLAVLIGVVVIAVLSAARQSATPTGTGATRSEDVHITLIDHKIQADKTVYETGVNYHFIIENKGTSIHEFAIGPKGFGEDEEKLHKEGLGEVEDIDLGTTKTLDLTFKKSAPLGTLELLCAYPNHYAAGMRLDIEVR
jgi:uncharacterized cupredoxin-like copper-binding protein